MAAQIVNLHVPLTEEMDKRKIVSVKKLACVIAGVPLA